MRTLFHSNLTARNIVMAPRKYQFLKFLKISDGDINVNENPMVGSIEMAPRKKSKFQIFNSKLI